MMVTFLSFFTEKVTTNLLLRSFFQILDMDSYCDCFDGSETEENNDAIQTLF